MTRDELEFSISQYLDGSLPVGEKAALETILADDADARALLSEYRDLQNVLKLPVEMPAVQWDALASHLSQVVAAAPVATSHLLAEHSTDDSLDELVVGYSDGTLPAEQHAAFDDRLAVDSNAAALLAQYRRLDSMLLAVKSVDPLPTVRWDALAEHLSGVVADANAKPIFSFRWARTAGRIAIAASVLLATVVGFNAFRSGRHAGPVASGPGNAGSGFAVVVGPRAETATSSPVLEIQIGGPSVANAAAGTTGADNEVARVNVDGGGSPQFADVIVSQPSRVVIANGDNAAQDSAQMPY